MTPKQKLCLSCKNKNCECRTCRGSKTCSDKCIWRGGEYPRCDGDCTFNESQNNCISYMKHKPKEDNRG